MLHSLESEERKKPREGLAQVYRTSHNLKIRQIVIINAENRRVFVSNRMHKLMFTKATNRDENEVVLLSALQRISLLILHIDH